MDFQTLLVLGLLWFFLNLLGKKRRPTPPTPQSPARRSPGPAARTLPSRSTADATQREGSRLDALLRDLGRTLDQAAGTTQRLPEAKPAPPRRTAGAARLPGAAADFDEEAETVIARRLAGAEAHSKALSEADHAAFEERIRQQPADHTATRRYTSRQLRDAVVWREILGPPVSFREGSDV